MFDTIPEPQGGPPPHLQGDANHDLRDRSKDIFFAAVSTTRMPMIGTDPNQPDNPIVFANPAFVNVTGYSPDLMQPDAARARRAGDPVTVYRTARPSHFRIINPTEPEGAGTVELIVRGVASEQVPVISFER